MISLCFFSSLHLLLSLHQLGVRESLNRQPSVANAVKQRSHSSIDWGVSSCYQASWCCREDKLRVEKRIKASQQTMAMGVLKYRWDWSKHLVMLVVWQPLLISDAKRLELITEFYLNPDCSDGSISRQRRLCTCTTLMIHTCDNLSVLTVCWLWESTDWGGGGGGWFSRHSWGHEVRLSPQT